MATAEAHTAEYPELVITPPGRWSALKLGELWHHRELIYFLTKRELQVRYKQSFFGISWAVLQPLVFALVFAFFFGLVPKVKLPGASLSGLRGRRHRPVAVHLQAITAGARSLVLDANLIAKVYFPRLALPISKALEPDPRPRDRAGAVVVVTLAYGVVDRLDGLSRPRLPAARRRHRLRDRRPCSLRSTSSTGTCSCSSRCSSRSCSSSAPCSTRARRSAIRPAGLVLRLFVNPLASVLDGIALGAARRSRPEHRQDPDLGRERPRDPVRLAPLLPASRAAIFADVI